MPPLNSPPLLKYLFTIHCTLAAPMEIGHGPSGWRRGVAITGGTVTGEGMNGKVVANGGADYMVLDFVNVGSIVDDDQTCRVDTRYALEMDDGIFIYVQTNGVRSGDPATLNAMMTGEGEIDESKYWFHQSVKLETDKSNVKYAWLNNRVIVARAKRAKGEIAYDAYYLSNE